MATVKADGFTGFAASSGTPAPTIHVAGSTAGVGPASEDPAANFGGFITHKSGPASSSTFEIDSASSLAMPSVYESVVDAGKVLYWTGVVFTLVTTAAPDLAGFGTGGALANGIIYEAIDSDLTTTLMNFPASVPSLPTVYPLTTHRDLAILGGGAPMTEVTIGAKTLFTFTHTIFSNQGHQAMALTGGQRVRLTVQDDLGAVVASFRARCTGALVDA